MSAQTLYTEAQVASIVALALGQFQQQQHVVAPTSVPAAPKPKPSKRKAKAAAAAQALVTAQAAREAKRAAGLAVVRSIAEGKAKHGVVYPTIEAGEALGYLFPTGTTELVLASTGTLFAYGERRKELSRTKLPADELVLLRELFASTRK